MEVIPVLDILGGVAVHAIRGQRSAYRPLESVLLNSANPVSVAFKLKESGFKRIYVADLDAIMNRGENLKVVEKIAEESGLTLMVDAGVFSVDQAERQFQHKVSEIVVGTETLPEINVVRNLLNRFGDRNIVVSLDLKNGRVLSKSQKLSSMSPVEAALLFQESGVNELILLDLARVGAEEGINFDLISQVKNCTTLDLFVGGGVRGLDDLVRLKRLGVSGALVATALHNGKINVSDLKRLDML